MNSSSATGALLCILVMFLYLIPTVIAASRSHKNTAALLVVNFFFGWTFIGWVGCLAWSFTDNTKKAD